jgi:phosphomannomutase
MSSSLECFKAYDIRGRIPDQLNDEIAYRIGRAYSEFLNPSNVIVGNDIRLTSRGLADALIRGLRDSGVDVINIGLSGTEEIYFATSYLQADGGIIVTASHNPKDYNGMKFVREKSKPISGDSGLYDIKYLTEENIFSEISNKGQLSLGNIKADYIDHLLGYVKIDSLKPLRIVCNAGNGGAGPIIDRLEAQLPFEFIKVHHEPDGEFPNGVPNPLIEKNRQTTIDAINANDAHLGIAWDGDFDRCFFFDEFGQFIEGYYIVGLLAQSFLTDNPGSKIIYDPRLTWNTEKVVEELKGQAICCKTGHAFIKERMRSEDAIYGGEMSAHHYFRDFYYCDSGMVPWLLIVELMAKLGKPLSELVSKYMSSFPTSGEINSKVSDPISLINKIESLYQPGADSVEYIDGLSINYPDWRFNIRVSNTEPLVRLNVESKGDVELMREKTKELLGIINN